jgi:hypothetical protein
MSEEYCNNAEEFWKDISGYIGLYMVSNWGRIKSLKKNYGNNGCYQEKILKPRICGKYGHLKIGLFKNNSHKDYLIHRLVLEAFIGSCPEGKEGCHNDGNPRNNCVENLRYDTRSNNQKDRKLHGTKSKIDSNGSKNINAKLNDNKVIEIRKLSLRGESNVKIAKLFEVSRCTVWKIVTYKIWKHVK